MADEPKLLRDPPVGEDKPAGESPFRVAHAPHTPLPREEPTHFEELRSPRPPPPAKPASPWPRRGFGIALALIAIALRDVRWWSEDRHHREVQLHMLMFVPVLVLLGLWIAFAPVHWSHGRRGTHRLLAVIALGAVLGAWLETL